ncbi:hypothetical protein PtA15_5A24 [Puccinia triticina]|uniref:Uncharacterized protein n=1 Tax=Puccinia triticina TaxID=208348 RepID=A0ABY7CH62_9BASI|nr:uncharacterized protein PtA15_5A24 [Puccinia triticina]WAQ84454.1 hypothetical protein PtA15_5A24 [Puccinia triticina]
MGYLKNIKNRLESKVELLNSVCSRPNPERPTPQGNLQLVESNFILVHLDSLVTHGPVRLLESFPDEAAAALLAADQTWRATIATSPDKFPQWIKLTGVKLDEKASGGKDEAKQDAGMVE